jgi:hypothetical protein
LSFTDPAKFEEWLSKLPGRDAVTVWAHNLAFDGTMIGLWDFLKSERAKLTDHTDQALPSFFCCRAYGRVFKFVDSLNIFRSSLATLGEVLKCPKLPMPAMEASDEEWLTYCKNDVLILEQTICNWLRFVDEHQLGRPALTLAGQAWTAWKTRFLEHPVHVHCCEPALTLERDAYYGGRVDCFFVGPWEEGPVEQLDVNSLYPSIMLAEDMPLALDRYHYLPTLNLLHRNIDERICAATVLIKSDVQVYPYRTGSRVIYPLGEFVTSLCGAELVHAVKKGHVKKVYKLATYFRKPLFRKFVTELYAMRKVFKAENNTIYDRLTKLLMNSLYGKFGQRTPEWFPWSREAVCELERLHSLKPGSLEILNAWAACPAVFDQEYHHPETTARFMIRKDFGVVEVGVDLGEGVNSAPIISACITAAARMRLNSLLKTAGNYNTLYCDTDSLFVIPEGKRRLELKGEIDPAELGKLKTEAVHEGLVIYCPKDYESRQAVKRKGIRKSARMLTGDTFEQEQWPSFRSLLKAGLPREYAVRTLQKKLRRKLESRDVGSDGWTTPKWIRAQ